MGIGEQIISARKKKGYSTTKLAKLAGIAQSTLREIELGNTSPTWDTIEKLCNALGITPARLVAEFFSEEEPAMPPDLRELLQEAASLTPEQRRHLTGFLKSLKDEPAGSSRQAK